MMKSSSPRSTAPNHDPSRSSRSAAAEGAKARSITPPVYGLDVVDQTRDEDGPLSLPPPDRAQRQIQRALLTGPPKPPPPQPPPTTPGGGPLSASLTRQLHPDLAVRVRRAFPVSSQHVALQSGFSGMGASQGAFGESGLLGASRGHRVGLASFLHAQLSAPNPSPLAEKTLYHEIAHTGQRAPAGPSLRRGTAPPIVIDRTNEADADSKADRAYRGLPVESPRMSFSGGPQTTQFTMVESRRRAESRRQYNEATKAYEANMGRVLRRDAGARAAATTMLGLIEQAVRAWAQSTGQQLDGVLEKSFGWKQGDDYFGAFRMSAENIREIFAHAQHKTLREQLKIIYNAVRNNNVSKWFKVAAIQQWEDSCGRNVPALTVHNNDDGTIETVDANFATNSGLGDRLEDSNELDFASDVAYWEQHDSTPQNAFPVGSHGVHEFSEIIDTSQASTDSASDRLNDMNQGRAPLRMHPIKMKDIELTNQEMIQIGLNRKELKESDLNNPTKLEAFCLTFRSSNPERPIPWERGGDYFDVLLNSATERFARDVGARTLVGISGSTELMLHTARNLNITGTTFKNLRLAMLGWMLEFGDHSFWEIMRAAQEQGLPFETGNSKGEMYEIDANFDPRHAADFQMNFHTMFPSAPDQLAYPRALLDDTYTDGLRVKSPNLSPQSMRTRYGESGVGIPNTILDRLNRDSLADLEQLDRSVQALPFKNSESVVSQSHNFQQFRLARATAAFIELTHRNGSHAEVLLAHLVAHRCGPKALGSYESLIKEVAADLPDADSTETERANLLVARGVPQALVTDSLSQAAIDTSLELYAIVHNTDFELANIDTPRVIRGNARKLREIRASRAYKRLDYHIGAEVNIVLGAFLRAIAPSLRLLAYSDRVVNPAKKKLQEQGFPRSVTAKIDDKKPELLTLGHGLVARVKALTEGFVAGPGARTRLLRALRARATDAAFADRRAAIGEKSLLMVIFGVARRKRADIFSNFTTRRGRETAMAGDAYAMTHEVLSDGALTASDAELLRLSAVVKRQAMANRATRYDYEMQLARDNLDDNLTSLAYNDDVSQPYRGLSPVELWAINRYSGHEGMGTWQGVLEGHDGDTDTSKTHAASIKAAVSGLNRLPVHHGTVYNGQSSWLKPGTNGLYLQDDIQRYVDGNCSVGTIIDNHNFLSASTTVATSFIPKPAYNVAWVISDLRTGRSIRPISDHPEELEVLFPPGARLIVNSVDTTRMNATQGAFAGKLVVRLSEI